MAELLEKVKSWRKNHDNLHGSPDPGASPKKSRALSTIKRSFSPKRWSSDKYPPPPTDPHDPLPDRSHNSTSSSPTKKLFSGHYFSAKSHSSPQSSTDVRPPGADVDLMKEELHQQQRQTEEWRRRCNFQSFKNELLIEMLVLKAVQDKKPGRN